MPPSEPLSLFAVTAPGLEEVAAAELGEVGIAGSAEPGGVAWQGPLETLYLANLRSRIASRVLLRVGEFRARTFFELERHARRVPWERFVAPGGAVRLRVTSRKSKLYHEGAVAQRVGEAIERAVGPVRLVAGTADDGEGEETTDGAQMFVVRFHYDRCTVSADTSGPLLHLRGYRQALARAPLRETIAAAMLRGSGWDGRAPLLDPMCGAGTIPIEAALIARRIAPGLAGPGREPRRHAFRQWPEFDARLWDRLVERAREEILPAAAAPIRGSDRDEGAIAAARANAERAGVLPDLALEAMPISAIEAPGPDGWLVSNPPYGVRVGESGPLRNLYAALGRVARERFPGWRVALLTADRDLERQTGLALGEAFRTQNGGIPVRLAVARVG
jgi:putative N6-adenine-specific DNA methylase